MCRLRSRPKWLLTFSGWTWKAVVTGLCSSAHSLIAALPSEKGIRIWTTSLFSMQACSTASLGLAREMPFFLKYSLKILKSRLPTA